MDDHAVQSLRRTLHQRAVKAQIPPGGAAAPSAFLAANGDPSVGHAQLFGIKAHPLRDDRLRLPGQVLNLRPRQWLPPGLPVRLTGPGLGHPILMLRQKPLNFGIGQPVWRPDQHRFSPDLQAQGPAAAANDPDLHVTGPPCGHSGGRRSFPPHDARTPPAGPRSGPGPWPHSPPASSSSGRCTRWKNCRNWSGTPPVPGR